MPTNNVITTTDRLILRELAATDARHFFELNSNPQVLKFTGDLPFNKFSDAQKFLVDYIKCYSQTGMGRWAVIQKQNDESF